MNRMLSTRVESMKKTKSRGFTLLEAIIVIVIVAIFGTMMVTLSEQTIPITRVFNWLQYEQILQGKMEQIVSKYRSDSTFGLMSASPSLTSFKSDVETNYSGYVVPGETGFILFTTSGGNYVGSWPPVSGEPSGNPVLIVTLQAGDQKVWALFTK